MKTETKICGVPDDPYETFISGETVDLVIPSRRSIIHDGWYEWFNDQSVAKYTDYGYFPNTPEAQEEYLFKLRNSSSRIALMILPKGQKNVAGVVSLSNISTKHRSAETAVVIGKRKSAKNAIFWGMEAKARLVEHGFEVIGLQRISGGQAMPLAEWQNYQILFGFRPEGIKRAAFSRGYKTFDCVLSACTLDDYLRVKEARGGQYWPGKGKMLELMRSIPKEAIAKLVGDAINTTINEYTSEIRFN